MNEEDEEDEEDEETRTYGLEIVERSNAHSKRVRNY